MDRDGGGAGRVGVTAQSPQGHAAEGILRTGSAFFANAAVTLVGIGAGAVFMMINEVLAARFLGVAAYGLYALALMVTRISAVLAVFGVPVSVLHYLPVHLSRGEQQHALGAVLGCIPLPLTIGLVLALVLGIGGDWIAANVLGQPGAGPFLATLGFAIPLLLMVDLLGIIVRGFGKALPAVVIQNMVPQLCSIAVLVTLILWNGPQIGVAYAQIGGFAISVPLGIWFVARLVRSQIGRAKPAFQLARLYGYALPITLNIVANLVIGLTDLFLLGVFRDASAVGTYRACMQIALVFALPMNALRATTAPVYTVQIAEGRRAALQNTYAAAVRLATLMAFPLLLVVAINGGDLLAIMGPAFVVGASALLVLACGQAVESAFSASHVVLMIGSRQRLEAGNMALAAGLNLILNLLLIPPLGLLGAALSTTTSLSTLAVLRAFQLHRILALRTLDRTLLRIVLVCTVPALLIWVISLALGFGPGSGHAALALRLVLMAVLIGIGLWRFCLDAQDRAMALRLLPLRGAAREPAAAAGTTVSDLSHSPAALTEPLMDSTFWRHSGMLREPPAPLDDAYVKELRALPSQLVFIMGCHRSGTSMLYHLLARAGQVDYVSAYDIVKYNELIYNRVTGREARVKEELEQLLRQEASRGLDRLPAGADVPEEYRFLMPQEQHSASLRGRNRLETLFFTPHLTPNSLDTFLQMCRKKRFLAGDDRPLVLKNPSDFYFNFFNAHQMLPEAKFIFIHRHPLPMINSYLHSFPAQLTTHSNYAALIDPGYADLFGSLSMRRQRLLRMYRSEWMCRLLTARLVEGFGYYMANVDRLPPRQYISVRYEDLCEDPAGCLTRIGTHLQLDLTPQIPPQFIAPRNLPLLDRVVREYAARLSDMAAYLERCDYPEWPDEYETASENIASR